MLCTVGLRIKGVKKFAVSDSSQSLVNVIFLFFLKYLI